MKSYTYTLYTLHYVREFIGQIKRLFFFHSSSLFFLRASGFGTSIRIHYIYLLQLRVRIDEVAYYLIICQIVCDMTTEALKFLTCARSTRLRGERARVRERRRYRDTFTL